MTDQHLDDAIDRVVREMTRAEPRPRLRHRVLDRIERPSSRWWTVPRLAAAAVVILLAAMFVVVERAPRPAVDTTGAQVDPARVAQPQVPGEQPRPLPKADRARAPKRAPAARPAPEPLSRRLMDRVEAASVTESEGTIDDPVLAPLDPISLSAIDEQPIRLNDITIAPLQIEQIRVTALSRR